MLSLLILKFGFQLTYLALILNSFLFPLYHHLLIIIALLLQLVNFSICPVYFMSHPHCFSPRTIQLKVTFLKLLLQFTHFSLISGSRPTTPSQFPFN